MIEGQRPPLMPEGWDVPFEEMPQAAFNLVSLDSLNNSAVRAQIPSLRQALGLWKDKDDPSLLIWRTQVMQRAHMPVWFVMALYSHLDSQGLPYMLVDHDSKFSAAENAEEIEKHTDQVAAIFGSAAKPQVLKTVSVGFPSPEYDRVVLVSGHGDFRIDKPLKRKLAKELGLANSAAKNATVNPESFDTTLYLGLIPGMVKPIIQPHLIGSVSGLAYMRACKPEEGVTVLSASPIDSILLRTDHFEKLLFDYARTYYTNSDCTDRFERIDREDYVFYRNRRTLDSLTALMINDPMFHQLFPKLPE